MQERAQISNLILTMSDSGEEPKTSQQEEASQSQQGTYLTCVTVFPLRC